MHVCGTRGRWVDGVSTNKTLLNSPCFILIQFIHGSDCELITKDTSHIALVGYPSGICCKYFFSINLLWWNSTMQKWHFCQCSCFTLACWPLGGLVVFFSYGIFKHIFMISWAFLVKLPPDVNDTGPHRWVHVESTLILAMAWCHLATRHYLIQCWHRSMIP